MQKKVDYSHPLQYFDISVTLYCLVKETSVREKERGMGIIIYRGKTRNTKYVSYIFVLSLMDSKNHIFQKKCEYTQELTFNSLLMQETVELYVFFINAFGHLKCEKDLENWPLNRKQLSSKVSRHQANLVTPA